MAEEMIAIPFPKELYDDIVRFSDGRADPAWIARFRVERWVEDNCSPLIGDPDIWGDRLEEVASKYAPDTLEEWQQLVEGSKPAARPLVWKGITMPAGSDVRMHYNREYHYAKIADGKIVDGDRTYTPNEWASKVARGTHGCGTSRNAWDALWFREPNAPHWISANALREQARNRHRSGDDAQA